MFFCVLDMHFFKSKSHNCYLIAVIATSWYLPILYVIFMAWNADTTAGNGNTIELNIAYQHQPSFTYQMYDVMLCRYIVHPLLCKIFGQLVLWSALRRYRNRFFWNLLPPNVRVRLRWFYPTCQLGLAKKKKKKNLIRFNNQIFSKNNFASRASAEAISSSLNFTDTLGSQ